jgi:hypothetical protein
VICLLYSCWPCGEPLEKNAAAYVPWHQFSLFPEPGPFSFLIWFSRVELANYNLINLRGLQCRSRGKGSGGAARRWQPWEEYNYRMNSVGKKGGSWAESGATCQEEGKGEIFKYEVVEGRELGRAEIITGIQDDESVSTAREGQGEGGKGECEQQGRARDSSPGAQVRELEKGGKQGVGKGRMPLSHDPLPPTMSVSLVLGGFPPWRPRAVSQLERSSVASLPIHRSTAVTALPARPAFSSQHAQHHPHHRCGLLRDCPHR